MGAALRLATPDDAEVLARLGRETFTDTFGHLYPPDDLSAFLEESHSPMAWSKVLSDPSKRTWIAAVERSPIGYAVAGPCKLPHPDVTSTCGELQRIYVARSHQGAGAGRMLLDAALAWLGTSGRAIWIGVYSDNFRAQQIYASRGFIQVGEYAFRVGETRDRELILRWPGTR